MPRPILLVNANIARPPVSPVGLEYVGEALVSAGIAVQVVDLSFEPDWKASLRRQSSGNEPLAVGLSVRNTDDCSFASRKSFLLWIDDVISEIRKVTAAPIFLGGVGFSTMPEAVLGASQADAGVDGDGETAMPALAEALAKGADFTSLPNMVYRRGGGVLRNPRVDADLRYWPRPRRHLFNNKKYESLGAMVGLETKRGCSQRCIYCADPVAKGRKTRVRPPQVVVQELLDLVDQGVSWLHLCDSEFNLPEQHAKDVCQAIMDAGLAGKIRWFCYCSPSPFGQDLARIMRQAGCAGINFGVDSLCDEQLRRLGRAHSSSDIDHLVRLLRTEGLNYIFDLLIGGPGETEHTLKRTIDKAREFDVPLVGMAAGVRVYPQTPLAGAIADGSIKGKLYADTSERLHDPVFYLSPFLGDDIFGLVQHLVEGDRRFLVLSAPAEEGSYNYADDEVLGQLIEKGERGAYWDIIRRNRKG